MQPELNHGRRLTDEEYQRGVVALQSRQPAMPTREQDRAARRAELDLTIDPRLGVNFPADRREALWTLQERVEKRRRGLIVWHLLSRMWGGALERRAQGLARFLVREYAEVLTPAELESYFGSEEARNPALPVEDRGETGR